MDEFISKNEFSAWVASEILAIESLGEQLKKNPRKQERMKALKNVLKEMENFIAQGKQCSYAEMSKTGVQARHEKTAKFFSEGAGHDALRRAHELSEKQMSYRKIAKTLEVEGYRTVNGLKRWSNAYLAKVMKTNCNKEGL